MRPSLLLALSLIVAAASCRQVIGVEEATLAPSVPNTGGSASAGSSSQSGSTGAGGAQEPLQEGGASSVAGAAAMAAGTGGVPTGTGGTQGGAGGQPPESPTLCDSYCDAAMEYCTGSLAIYTSREMCLAVCAALPEGEPGDSDKKINSVHCRLEAALAAGVSEPEYSCPIAAPGANGQCGSNCENLCALRTAVCTEWVSGTEAECLTNCAALDDLGGYTVDPDAVPSHTRGGHVQCRLYHVSAAATDEPDTHCLHADGAPPCIEL